MAVSWRSRLICEKMSELAVQREPSKRERYRNELPKFWKGFEETMDGVRKTRCHCWPESYALLQMDRVI
eukprot:6183705-Pleurochrysis_carterae.AAC.1